jgi:Peroxidase, family 2
MSYPFAAFLTLGGFILLQQWEDVSLADLARHNCIEHDASLVHDDTLAGTEYAPCKLDDIYLKMLLRDARDNSLLTVRDIACARVRREHQSIRALDKMHSEIARGEMALVLEIFGRRGKAGRSREISVETISEWLKSEKFPA